MLFQTEPQPDPHAHIHSEGSGWQFCDERHNGSLCSRHLSSAAVPYSAPCLVLFICESASIESITLPNLMRTMALWYTSTANRPEKNCSLKPYESRPPLHFFTLWGIQHSAAHNDTPADSNNWEVTLVLSGNTGWLLSQSTLCLQSKSLKPTGSNM